MPSGDDDIIIRNGTIKRWLRYYVVFFGHEEPGYSAIEGGLRIRGQWLVALALLIGVVLGGWWF